MNSLVALHRDRRRSQRGSVLSGVLIILAFLAIIAGALLTELSTNFLLSTALVNRVTSEATVDSGMELAIAQLQDTQTTPLFNGCPGTVAWPSNGLTALVTHAQCYPVIDAGSSRTLSPIAAGGQFLQDGIEASVGAAGVEYLNGDTKGNLFAFAPGSSSPAWEYQLGATTEVVGTPLAMPDVSAQPDGVSYVVPVTYGNGGPSGCTKYCVALLSASGMAQPSPVCIMSAVASVGSQPAAGLAFPNLAYFGDGAGNLYAYSATSAPQSGGCVKADQRSVAGDVPGAGAIVAGPFVLKATSGKAVDNVYVVVAAGSAGYLVHYTMSANSGGDLDFAMVAPPLPLPGVGVGASLSRGTSQLAISFSNGQVAVVQIHSNFSTTLVGPPLALGATISDGPVWSSAGTIGVAAGSALYVLDANLNLLATYVAPSTITTAPAADNGGDWFVGTSGGVLYTVQSVAGSAQMFQPISYPGAGSVTSAPIAMPCSTGICIYLASSDGNVYFAGLDARDALMDSCVGTCATGHFSLRVRVEVGDENSPSTVHVQSWSYYSP